MKLLKVIKIIGIALASLILIVIISAAATVFAANKALTSQHKSSPITLTQSLKISKKRALVIYQPSMGDTTKKIAMSLAKSINKRGYTVTVNYPGDYLNANLSQYSIVVFGTPVYMSHTSAVLDKYIKRTKIMKNIHVLYFETGLIPSTAKETAAMKSKVTGANLITAKFISKSVQDAKLLNTVVDNLCS